MDTQFFWGIIAGALIVFAVVLVPTILQIKRTAKAAEDFLRTTEESLNPLLRRLQETVDKTNQVVGKVDEAVGDVRRLTKAVGETGAAIEEINNLIRQVDTFIASTISGFGTGIKTALSVLTQGLLKKGG